MTLEQEQHPVFTGTLKWAFIWGNGFDEFVDVFDSLNEAIAAAECEWEHLTDIERGYQFRFEVSMIHVEQNADGDWDYFTRDDGMCDADTYETACDWTKV